MTAQEKTKLGAALAVIVSALVVLTAAKGSVESWLLPRSEYRDDQHRAELRAQRDSLFQLQVLRWIAYQNCKESFGRSKCLRPDR